MGDDTARSLHVVELTVPFETSFVEATEGKVRKYGDLTEQARMAGYTAMLITLEVGSSGVINMPGFTRLKEMLKIMKSTEVQTLGVVAAVYAL